ncbi:hypothetical protein [Lactococcus lactis]|uniref:hypothetical protein n=1 Tax=Lactococcus lactis TaxID=1358 RepID=UPI002417FCF0|nr:hypothetical protein [Lactococcus lactis]MDG4958563.1 hypothetical protein [Lactococcus lactis]
MAKEREITQSLISVIVNSTQDGDEGIVEIIGGISKFYPNVFDMYDVISVYIYGLVEKDFVALKDYFKEEPDIDECSFQKLVKDLSNSEYKDLAEQGSPLRKFERHIKLACTQRDFIQNNIQQANDLAKDTKKISDEAHDVAKNARSMAETAEKLKGKIYSEFIAILGIFTAISFMSMGSLQVLGDLFKDVKDPTSASVGYALIVGGIYISIMYVFVIIMFVGMKKVVGNGDSYNFSFGVCALVLITITALFGTGLFITGHVVPGLMILTICAVGLIVSFLATHPMATESK